MSEGNDSLSSFSKEGKLLSIPRVIFPELGWPKRGDTMLSTKKYSGPCLPGKRGSTYCWSSSEGMRLSPPTCSYIVGLLEEEEILFPRLLYWSQTLTLRFRKFLEQL